MRDVVVCILYSVCTKCLMIFTLTCFWIACMNPNQCTGVGTWDGWFEGLYNAVIDAFQPGIPVYVRWVWQDKNVRPLYLSYSKRLPIPESEPRKSIQLSNLMCFEHVYARRCPICFRNSVSVDTMRRFKLAAYKLVDYSSGVLPIPNTTRENVECE